MSPATHHTAPSAATIRTHAGETEPVLIAGAGIAGLSLALALSRHGLPSLVFEKRSAFVAEGAGIQIGPNGVRILQQLDLLDELMVASGRPNAVMVRDATNGNDIVRLPLPKAGDVHSDTSYLTLHRRDLHQALAAKAERSPLITLTMATPVTKPFPSAGGVRIQTENGVLHQGRLLAIADGLHSNLRLYHFAASPLTPIGKAAIRTVIPARNLPPCDAQSTVLWLGQNIHAVHYPVTGGREIAMVVVVNDNTQYRGWSNDVTLDWLLTQCGNVADDLKALLHLGQGWRAWTLYAGGTSSSTVSNRMVLLGDAAHPILPFLAQGGVMGMEDAVVLADTIAKAAGDMTGALRRYDHVRRHRTNRISRASNRNGHIYQLTGLQAAIRNAAMRMLGGKALMRQYDWLYDWRPPEMPKR